MSSAGLSSETNKAAELFEDLWRQLRSCHQNALEELEAKVGKLKKERCLDAQRLEVFYSRNQQLKEQNKSLQDALSLLEERLRTGKCDRCAALEEDRKIEQEQNVSLITKLKIERNRFEVEARKIHAELQELKMSRSASPEAITSEQEEGFIPDSPVLASSLPVTSRLKKHKYSNKRRHVRYRELPLPHSSNSLFKELNKDPVDASKNPGKAELLVPNTCDLESSQIPKDIHPNREEVIAETCVLELIEKHHVETEMTPEKRSSSGNPLKNNGCSNPEKSPSLLSQDGTIHKVKRRKDDKLIIWEGGSKHIQLEMIKCTSTSSTSDQSVMKQPHDSGVWPAENGPQVFCASPPFKKPDRKGKEWDSVRKKRILGQDVNKSHDQHETEEAERRRRAEPTWSIDPAVALSMYDSEGRGDEQAENEPHGELVDTDCTWVSHSLLQGQGKNRQDVEDSVSGLGEKANDSLDVMFDTTTYGEYKSQPCGADDDDSNDDEDDAVYEEEEIRDQDDPENSAGQSKARHPTFAHVAVIRKKDERRKLKGTTCKECEIYYAHLPEEEKQKKLAACSRHRFLYIPPSTPENFWEVGFPSTQTCIERGYIKEETNPQVRSRRRQPLNALFSPKQES